MPSRLSSLLVRDGLIGVKRMERAFQRQVIYGGALDTILLEMAQIDEATLCDYLSLATGLPAASTEQLELIASEATELCPEEVARRYHVAPLTIENDALRVLVSEPVDFTELEDLADQLDLAIQPLVAPEFRFNLLFSRAFGLQPSARFSKLAEAVAHIEPTLPAEQAAPAPEPSDGVPTGAEDVDSGWTLSGVFEAVAPPEVEPDAEPDAEPEAEPEPERVPATVSEAVRSTARFSSDALQQRLASAPRVSRIRDAYRVVRPLPEEPDEPGELADPEAPETIEAETPETIEAIEASWPGREAPAETDDEAERVTDPSELTPVTAGSSALAARGADRFHGSEAIDGGGIVSGLIYEETERVGPPHLAELDALSPLSIVEATALLASATDRDQIFRVLLRTVAAATGWGALLIIQGGEAMGRFAVHRGQLITDGVSAATIPLDAASPFQRVATSASPYIGKLATGNPAVDEQVVRVAGQMPPSALLLPVALRERVVAIALGHGGSGPLQITALAELLPLATAAAAALIRLIKEAKKQASAAARAAVPPATEANADSKPAAIDEITELLDGAESTDRGESSEAVRALLGRVDEVVPYLDDRFPGRLDLDRYAANWRTVRASQYGPIMDLVIKIGTPCGPMLAAKLDDPRRDIRYYAAVCAAELRPAVALGALAERVFDRDFGVREIALHALAGYPARELEGALGQVRQALDAGDGDRVVAAARALAALGDLAAVPHLIDALAASDAEGQEAARRALRRLTSHDFGSSPRKWLTWWEENRQKNRLEWLIEALGQRDEELRRQAGDDLRTLTGEELGFRAEAPRRQRDEARRRWREWWQRERHRF